MQQQIFNSWQMPVKISRKLLEGTTTLIVKDLGLKITIANYNDCYDVTVHKSRPVVFRENAFDMFNLHYEDCADYTRFYFEDACSVKCFLATFTILHQEYFSQKAETMTVA